MAAAHGGRLVPAQAWVWGIPALAAVALYARTIGYGFVWDDQDLIVHDAVLQSGDWAQRLLQDFWQATGGGSGMWRPLVTLSFRVDGALAHGQAWTFHAVNVAALAASAALVARLALARGTPRVLSLGAGLLYATAPALSESTAWIAGRSDAFVALMTLAALVLSRTLRPAAGRVATAIAAALALLAKESALVLPLLLAADAMDAMDANDAVAGFSPGADAGAAADVSRVGSRRLAVAHTAKRPHASASAARRAWRAAWPSLLAVALWALVHRALVSGSSHPPSPGAAQGIAALVWAHLAWLAPWAPHSPLLDLWHAPGTATALLAWLALAGVAVVAFLCAQRRLPVLLPLALVFFPLLPVAAASLVESGVRFAERELALPVAGMALGAAWLGARAPVSRAWLARTALAAWVVLQAAAAWPAIGAWRDEESRIRRVASVRPRDLDALLGMADLLSSEGRAGEALAWIQRAEVVAPGSAAPLVARSTLAYRAGHTEDALALAERALALAPNDLAGGVVRVRSLVRLGRAGDARAAGDRLVAAHPDAPAAQGALGEARMASGDPAGAIAPLELASDHAPDDAGLAWDLGRAAIAMGQVERAHQAFERAAVAAPQWYDAWLAVADTRSRVRDQAGAERALARAASLPGAADGRVEALRRVLAQRAGR